MSVVVSARAIDQVRPSDIMIGQESADVRQDGLELRPVGLHRVDVDTDHAKPATLKRAVNLIQGGNFCGVGQAPACPEDDQDHIAFEIGQAHGSAVDVVPDDRWRRLADQVELSQAASAESFDRRVIRLFG